MKAMSLRMRMQTLSPCVTPSRSRPPAMRAARFPTSAWSRLRWPLMMPWKRVCVDTVSFRSRRSFRNQAVIPGRCEASNPESRGSGFVSLRYTPRNDEKSSNIRKARRALFDVGADRLDLVGSAHQFHLLDGFGQQRRAGIGGKIVQHALGGAGRFRALAGDLARDFEGGCARVIADPGRKAVTQRFLRREN